MIFGRRILTSTLAAVVGLGVLTPSGVAVASAVSQSTTSTATATTGTVKLPETAHGSAADAPSAGKSSDTTVVPKVPAVDGAVSTSLGESDRSVLPVAKKPVSNLRDMPESSAAASAPSTGVPTGFSRDSIEVPSARTANSSTFANLDGTYSTKVFQDRVHFQDGNGIWQDVNPVLKAAAGGRHVESGNSLGIGVADSATSHQLMTVQIDGSHSASFSLLGAQPSTGAAKGSTESYAGVLPNTDLQLTSIANGLKEAIVLSSPAAPHSWTFAMQLQGLTARLDAHGNVYLYDETGAIRGVVPHGSMEDSNIDPHSKQGAVSDAVTYSLVTLPGGGQGLRVQVDDAWLNDPARVYPVTVDPSTLVSETDHDDTYVMSNFSANYSGDGVLKVGTYDGGTHQGAAYLHFNNLGWLTYTHILQANLSVWEQSAWSCTPSGVSVYGVTVGWDGTTMRDWPGAGFWGQLAHANAAYGGGAGCPSNWLTFSDDRLTGLVNDWVNGRVPNNGLTIRADSATDSNGWKILNSSDNTAGKGVSGDPNGFHNDALVITWSPYNATYAPSSTFVQPVTNNQPGKVWVHLTNTGQTTWTANSTFKLGYHTYDSTDTTAQGFASALTVIPTTVAHGQSVDVLATVNPMPAGKTYVIHWDMADWGTAWFEDQGVPYYAQKFDVPNVAPVIKSVAPDDGSAVSSLTPTLTITGSDPDAYPNQGTNYAFEICTGIDANSGDCKLSGWTASNSTGIGTWSPPAGFLQWRHTYYWRVQIGDGQLGSGFTAPIRLTVLPVDPDSQHLGSDAYAPLVGNANPLTGNYTSAVTDIAPQIHTGPNLVLNRTYNSLNTNDGPFGKGWSTPLDMTATPDAAGNMVVGYGDGHTELYAHNSDGSYAPPAGYFSALHTAPMSAGAFTGADSTTSLGTNVTGQAWNQIAGTWGVSGHKAYLVSGGAHSLASVPASSNGTVTFTETTAAAGLGVAFHIQDQNNYMRVVADPASNTWQIIKRVDGADYVKAQSAAGTCCNPGDVMRVSYASMYVYLYRNNVLLTSSREQHISPFYAVPNAGITADGPGAGRIGLFQAVSWSNSESFAGQPDSANQLGVTDSGDPWRTLRGTWGVSGGSAYLSAANAAGGNLVVTDAAPDGEFSFTLPSGVPAIGSGLAFRVADKDNFWRVTANTSDGTPTGTPIWQLVKRVAGTDTIVTSGPAGACSTSYTLTTSQSNINLSCGNAILSASDSTFQNQSQAGPYADTVGNTRWDGFSFTTATVLTEKDGTNYYFADDGHLYTVVNATGAVSLTYDADNGQLATAYSSPSGRGLRFGWTNNHITSVTSDPVTPGGSDPLTWTYGYTGSLLTSVKAPGASGSTTYVYSTSTPVDRLTQITLPTGHTAAKMAYNPDASLAWSEDGLNHRTTYTTNIGQTSTTSTVTDPNNNTTTYVYDVQGRLTSRTSPTGKTRTYHYNDLGYLDNLTDENHNSLVMTTDSRGNILSRTTTRQAGQIDTSYYSYFLGVPGDPRNDKLTISRDARSTSPTDNTYATIYSYTPLGDLLTKTTPPTPDQPGGATTSYQYAIGNEVSTDQWTVPAEVLLASTDARGKVTHYGYNHAGDLTRQVDPSGLAHDYSYDGLGRVTTSKETSDSYPAALTTTYTYDNASHLSTVTEPSVTNPVTGVTHTKRTSYTYDADENPTLITLSDTTGGDASRITHLYYDGDDRVIQQIDAAGNNTYTSYDAAGNVATTTDGNGTVTAYSYTKNNQLYQTTIKNFVDDPVTPGTQRDVVVDSRTYDDGGRLVADTNALGQETDTTYYTDDLVASTSLANFHDPDPTTGTLSSTARRVSLTSYTYDAAGNQISVTNHGASTTTNVVDAANRTIASTLDPTGLARTTTTHYDPVGNPTQTVLSATGTSDTRTTLTSYTDAGLPATTTTVNDASPDLVASHGYDQRGLETATTDPRGYRPGQSPDPAFTTNTVYDQAGRITRIQLPPVNTETGGGTPTVARPTSTTGYNTFGDKTQNIDADGNITSYGYNANGDLTSVTYPSYTPKGSSTPLTPTESFSYDHNRNLLNHQDRRGQTTSATYDKRNRLVAITEPAATSGGTRPVTRYTYDDNNNQLTVTTPTGAKTAQAYDDLGRVWASTAVERTPSTASYTTYTLHDDSGNITRFITPDNIGSGNSVTATYNAANELTSTTDEAGRTTLYGRTLTGDIANITDNAGRKAVYGYDKAGRLMSLTEYDHTGAQLRSRSVGEDGAGNVTSATTPNGFTTTKIYDAANQLSSITQPLTATSNAVASYGYDAAGNRTRVTNPNNNSTITTYNSLGLPEDVIEPSTTAHPALSDRTTTTLYNPAGDVTSILKPGGVTVTSSYDNLGQLTGQSGTGAEASTAAKSLGYDLDGRLTSFSVTGGTETIGYNDRGMPVSATGPAGNASFAYDASGLETSRTDAAGIGTFTYNPDASLATATDSSTGATATYGYDSVGNLHTTSYGTGNVNRTYGYDDLNRLTSDTLTSGAGTMLRSDTYGYDNDDNRTSRTISPAPIKGNGTNTYTYDQADRLISWTDPSNATTTYKYDAAGNRTKVNNNTLTYDARNELLSQGSSTFTYNARGDLSSTTTGSGTTTSQVFDAFDRMVSDNGVGYTYDALDRITSHNGKTTQYAGTEMEPVADGNQTFSRDPNGNLLGFKAGSTAREIFTDAHQDVVSTFDAGATSIGAQIVYDPYGNTLATAGTIPDVGYQSSWTDPGTDRINMEARWYGPGRADFLSSDTYDVPNKYNYANDNPFAGVDRNGHCPVDICERPNGGGIGIPSWNPPQIDTTQLKDNFVNNWKKVGQGIGSAAGSLIHKIGGIFTHGSTSSTTFTNEYVPSAADYVYAAISSLQAQLEWAASFQIGNDWLKNHPGVSSSCYYYGCGPTASAGGGSTLVGTLLLPLLPPAPPWWQTPVPSRPIPGSTWTNHPKAANPAGKITILHAAAGSGSHPEIQANECSSNCASIAGAVGASGTAAGCAAQEPGAAMSSCAPSKQNRTPDEDVQNEVDVLGPEAGSSGAESGAEAEAAPKFARSEYGRLTPTQRAGALEKAPTCPYCGDSPSNQVDHITSLKRDWESGGRFDDYPTRTARVNSPDNTIGACQSCNAAKQANEIGTGEGQWWPRAWPPDVWWPFGGP